MNKIKRKIKELFIYFLRKIKINLYILFIYFISVTHAQFDQCQDFWLTVMDYPRASRSSTRGSQARVMRLAFGRNMLPTLRVPGYLDIGDMNPTNVLNVADSDLNQLRTIVESVQNVVHEGLILNSS